ncbi:MAG: hypothetical protein CO128_07425 [Ignavibacteriales bacterium CG_4_9_14_3_um_filter_30_11]|nr:MAG: hypothetical protein CO128_07425 [Ignavibacteriales bacterium CG_4_9_14_3_um_filter_30_11]
MKKLLIINILLLFIFTSFTNAQSKNPDDIIKNLKKEFEKVKNYQVNVKIKVDATMIKMPEMKAEFYFKQPDKTFVKSTSFAMIPKQGVNFSPVSYLKGEYTAVFARNENVNGRELSVVKIIPNKEDNEILLTTMWVDQVKNVIRKIESTTKENGTFNVEFNFDENLDYPLPSNIIFSFNLNKIGLQAKLEDKLKRKKGKRDISGMKGKVVLTYSDYKVNTNLPDSLFITKNDE